MIEMYKAFNKTIEQNSNLIIFFKSIIEIGN